MPLAPTPCATPGCYSAATYRGHCRAHRPKAWAGSSRKKRLPPDWSTRRLIVLRRDAGICHICGGTGADEVDHITPGDDHSLDNLAPIHQRTAPYCHRQKSSEEGNKAKQQMRAKRKLAK